MEQSSIYTDLKKFAGVMKARRDDEVAVTSRPADSGAAKPCAKEDPAAVIRGIVAMVTPPLTALRDATGYVHDESTLALRCPIGHIHKYFLNDISAGNVAGCVTCQTGTRFMVMVREIAESTLGVPFAVVSTDRLANKSASVVEYHNPVLKLTLATHRGPGDNSRAMRGDQTVVNIHPTSSPKKVKTVLGEFLRDLPALSAEQRAKLGVQRRAYVRSPLPFTPELAAINVAGSRVDPLVAVKQLNVVSDTDTLRLENC